MPRLFSKISVSQNVQWWVISSTPILFFPIYYGPVFPQKKTKKAILVFLWSELELDAALGNLQYVLVHFCVTAKLCNLKEKK